MRSADAERPSVSVVVPVYNSARTLPDLVAALLPVLGAEADRAEVILVDDGSRDGSWPAIEALTAAIPTVVGLRLMRNYGQHNALLCGIRAARYDVVITMDDDLQNPPSEIPILLRTLREGHDVVYGVPAREQHGLWRNLASQITKIALQSAMGAPIARKVTAFRAFRTQVREAFVTYQGPSVSVDVLLTWGTTRFAAVQVAHNPRRDGQSNYSFPKLVTHALNMMTGFSVVPLQLASFLGFSFMLFGVGVLGWVVGRYLLEGGAVPGFPFLASIIALFSGVQLFALGVIGEYLARMHFRMMERPAYVIREGSPREPA